MAAPEKVRVEYKERNQPQLYQFPDTLYEHGTLLEFKKYSYAEKNDSVAKPAAAQLSSSILLPLPEQLLENSGIKIAANQLGALGAGAAEMAAAVSSDSVGDSFRGMATLENAKTVLGLATTKIIKEGLSATGLTGAQKGIEAGLGATFNPFQAITFEGVDLKAYVLDWTLAPTTRKESETLQKIIKRIRHHIHPGYKNFGSFSSDDEAAAGGGGPSATQMAIGGRAFLSYPDVCHIRILGSPDGSLITFKPAMVGAFQVNYAGGGELAFLEGGVPAVVKITMNITEMQIWTRGDYA